MATGGRPLVTPDEFVRMPDPADGSKLELVRGVVVVSPPSRARRGICCAAVGQLLGNHDPTGRLGWVTVNNTGVILEREPDTLLGPDVAFWSIARKPTVPAEYFDVPPDIVVEVLSPDDRRKDVRAKIKDYLFYGVPLVWLADPETRTVTVYRGSLRGTELDEEDTLDPGDILPGFSCKVADIFA